MKIVYFFLCYCFLASTVLTGYPPSITTRQTLSQGSSGIKPSLAPSVQSVTEVKTDQQGATKLKDTTVVIIVSVSLAVLVCAIIPLIFYGHCRSNIENQNRQEENKGQAGYYEENAGASTPLGAVRLPSLDPESSAQDASQYVVIYQALDPEMLD